MTEFLTFPKVVEFLVKQGIDDPVNTSATVAGQGALQQFLPAQFEIELETGAIAGSLGDSATRGFVAFNLYYENVASWMVVMDVRGKLHQVAPACSVESEGQAHFAALKNYDEDTLLVISDQNYTGGGHAYLWRWRDDVYTRLAGHTLLGVHDIQMAASSRDDARRFWAPETPWPSASGAVNNANVSLFDADTGACHSSVVIHQAASHCTPHANAQEGGCIAPSCNPVTVHRT